MFSIVRPSIFIGSSSEQSEVMKEMEVHLSKFAEVTCWDSIFSPGQSFLSDLSNNKDLYDFAIFIINPDDILLSRESEYLSIRDNVIFEIGLFIGSIGFDRVYGVKDQNKKSKIPSDYYGITFLQYNGNRADKNLAKALSPTCTEIKRVVDKIGVRNQDILDKELDINNRDNAVGLDKIYKNYDEAEKDIINDLKTTQGPVRLFFQIASSSVGVKGKLFEILDELANQRKVEVRILHASETSKLFSRERLLSMNKDPNTIISTLKYVHTSLKNIESRQGSSLLRRTHNLPYFWRMYSFEHRMYIMPYFKEKDAGSHSPVLVFSKQSKSMYNTFTDWFDHTWDVLAPKEMNVSDIITPATPSGTALFLKWKDYHVFGIPKRDLIEESDYLRFFGIGGKKHSDESYEECAIREGNEETDDSIEEIRDSKYTHFLTSIGTLEEIKIINSNKTPRLILEKKNHSGYGSMSKLDDIYYLLAFDATLLKKPKASGELAALVFVKDHQLSLIKKRNDLSIGELIEHGMILEEQEGISINRNKILVPHGTAVYLMRKIS
jgi:Predicted nucleotide-binding protein containing TIR-like domain